MMDRRSFIASGSARLALAGSLTAKDRALATSTVSHAADSANRADSPALRPFDLKLDVSDAVALPGPHHLAATVYLPAPALIGDRPVIAFAVPGGGYARGYFDMHFAGHDNYSQAEYHTARGMIFVTMDHLGVGDSSLPDPVLPTLEMLAAAYDHAVRDVMARLASGQLAPSLPPIERALSIGIGQSMGGCVTIIAQGRHATFDAIAPLGFSAFHTVLPQPTMAELEQIILASLQLRRDNLNKETIAAFSATNKHHLYHHHWEDVPADIVAVDKGTPPAKFRSITMPYCGAAGLIPGCVSAEAAAICVPVLIGLGERDVCPAPHAEPGGYRSSRDVSLFIAPTMAHMHNFASTRELLWRRIDQWVMQLRDA